MSGLLIPAAVFLPAITKALSEPTRAYPPMPPYVPRQLVPGELCMNASTEEEIAHNQAIYASMPPGPDDGLTFAEWIARTEPSYRLPADLVGTIP